MKFKICFFISFCPRWNLSRLTKFEAGLNFNTTRDTDIFFNTEIRYINFFKHKFRKYLPPEVKKGAKGTEGGLVPWLG